MAMMVKNRPLDTQREATSTASIELDEARMNADVSEVDHSVYEEMERSWVGEMPQGVAEARKA